MNIPVSLPSRRWPDLSHVVTEDDTPVDNLFSEKEMRLLTAPLYESERAQEAIRRAQTEAEKAARFAERLRALGVDPDAE